MSGAGVAASLPFDARPLVEAVSPTEARAFVDELSRTGRLKKPALNGVVFIVVIAAIVLIMFGSVSTTILSLLASATAAGSAGGGTALLFALLPLVVIGIVAAVAITLFISGRRTTATRMYRLDRFARANGMTYEPRLDAPGLPGMIFSIGSSRHSADLVRGDRPRFVEFANYRYTTGSGKNQQTHHWGYVAVKLDVPLPHIVLDARGNNSFMGSNLPANFDADQRLSLEGDFDRHFSLYCPAGYERDALYLFTPDIMARFIDNAAAMDVEIVDDWLFLYAKRDFSTLDPATWAWLFSVVRALLDKLAQWGRWRDERLAEAGLAMGTTDAAARGAAPGAASGASADRGSMPFAAPAGLLRPPPGVAPAGRRLTRRVSWVSIVAMIAIVAWWIVSQTGLLRLFFR